MNTPFKALNEMIRLTSPFPESVTVNAPIVMGPSLQKNYPFDPSKVLSGVSMISETYLALVVNANSPLKSMPRRSPALCLGSRSR